MTNSPEATTPDSSPDSTTTDAADGLATRLADAASTGTYDRLVEPRSENRLALESGRLAPDLAQVRVGAADLDRIVLR